MSESGEFKLVRRLISCYACNGNGYIFDSGLFQSDKETAHSLCEVCSGSGQCGVDDYPERLRPMAIALGMADARKKAIELELRRDHYAGLALTTIGRVPADANLSCDQVATWCYKMADAMLKERGK